MRRTLIRALAVLLVVPPLVALSSIKRVDAGVTTKIEARQVSAPLGRARTFELPISAGHIAVHWRGAPGARIRVAFSRDGESFERPTPVALDEVGEQRRGDETYGSVMPAGDAKAVRVVSDRRLGRVSVLAIKDGERVVRHHWQVGGDSAPAAVETPTVISRAGWGADESLRFDGSGKEKWPPTFHPTQKLIVHHTATQNGDPDPAATVRAIYYYHAVTQGWGDIGYNFLIDESGRTYEGRYSRPYAAGESPTGEDLAGNGVTGAHAEGYNSGTVGVALLGTLTERDATAPARDALERFLAWKADGHGIDAEGSSLYTNPVSGTQKVFPNIAGHRDVNPTECPGSVFYSTLPDLRQAVATRMQGTAGDTTPPAAPTLLTATAGDRTIALDWADNEEVDLAGYRVYRRKADGSWPTAPTATTTASSYLQSGLKNGTSYTYRVTAYDRAGNEGAPSSEATATPRRPRR